MVSYNNCFYARIFIVLLLLSFIFTTISINPVINPFLNLVLISIFNVLLFNYLFTVCSLFIIYSFYLFNLNINLIISLMLITYLSPFYNKFHFIVSFIFTIVFYLDHLNYFYCGTIIFMLLIITLLVYYNIIYPLLLLLLLLHNY